MKIEPENHEIKGKPPKMEREDLLEESKLGFDFFFTKFPHVSKIQILWFFLVNYCWVVGGLVQSILDTRYNTSYEEGLLFSPKDSCSQFSNIDSLCSSNMSLETCLQQLADNSGSLEIEACSSGYIFDKSVFTRTVTTDFELVCENAYIESTISSIFFAGLFFGVFIFGPITDKIGRTKASVIASFLNFERMISGFFSISAGTGTFVYTMEVIGPKYRTWFGCMTQGIFAVGYALLSLVGYLLKDWQDQMIVLTLAPLFVIPIFLYLPYSTAWIYSQKQYKDARENVKLIGKKYAIETDEKFLDELENSVKAQQKSENTGKIYTQIGNWLFL
ncbi:unnamed protein product [Oikopleura dioica]|uniref:Major facilitator superfamily (MFS) profile domain-containing protein n=1 Tax=Oikopleura dioica TaxID=34765 RepID=E4YI28_OIKDI|nr:unnamed protein product [Oikopleura dioica]